VAKFKQSHNSTRMIDGLLATESTLDMVEQCGLDRML